MAAPWMPNAKPLEQIEAPTDELEKLENEFRKNVKIFADNMQNITRHVHAKLSKKGDNHLSHLPFIVQIIQNYLLNLIHKSHLIKGYIFRVYTSKEDMDKRDPSRLFNDDDYLYGDFKAARPFAPLVKELYEKHLTEEEKDMAITFFVSFNQMAEDWLLEGAAEKILLASNRKEDKEDGALLVKIKKSINNVDAENPTPKQLENLYELLEDTREAFIKYRNERVANGQTILPPNAFKPVEKETKPLKDTRGIKEKNLKTDPDKKIERKKMASKIMNQSEESEEEEEKEDEQLAKIVNSNKVNKKTEKIVAVQKPKIQVTKTIITKEESSYSSHTETSTDEDTELKEFDQRPRKAVQLQSVNKKEVVVDKSNSGKKVVVEKTRKEVQETSDKQKSRNDKVKEKTISEHVEGGNRRMDKQIEKDDRELDKQIKNAKKVVQEVNKQTNKVPQVEKKVVNTKVEKKEDKVGKQSTKVSQVEKKESKDTTKKTEDKPVILRRKRLE